MTKTNIRSSIGIIFITSHFMIIVLVGVLYVFRGFTFEETTTTIAILAPVFAGYTTLIVRQALASQPDTGQPPSQEPSEPLLFVFVSLFFPTLFILMIVGIVLLRAYNVGIGNFEQFKIMLGTIEAIFATYVGLVMTALFSPGHPSDLKKSKGMAAGGAAAHLRPKKGKR